MASMTVAKYENQRNWYDHPTIGRKQTYVPDEAMEPCLHKGDAIWLTDAIGPDGIHAFEYQGGSYVARLQHMVTAPGSLRILCENKSHPLHSLTVLRKDISVFGRVVYAGITLA